MNPQFEELRDAVALERLLLSQLRWVVGLRWITVVVILIGAFVDHFVLGWYGVFWPMLFVAVGLGLFNVMFGQVLQMPKHRRPRGAVMGWTQVLVDLSSLTLLGLYTGGVRSPLLPFFVLHMIFSSLLQSSRTAYSVAGLTVVMYGLGLAVRGQLPRDQMEWVFLCGWGVSLIAAVYLTNHITQNLRRQRHRLLIQSRRSREMASQLRRHQQQMVQHEKMVAVGQMAAGMAHEIGNPLASMDAILQLQQRDSRYVTAENIQTMRDEVSRISDLSRKLNAYTRPLHNQTVDVSLNELAEQALGLVKFDRRFRDVQLDMQLSENDCLVRVQPQAVQQVLTNILINALDALAQITHPKVVIRTSGAEAEGVIEISDNGMGIGPEDIKHIFEPFYTTKPVGKGTGLGLAISFSLMNNMGGRLEVDSESGEGTSFKVYLPGSQEL